MVCPCGCGKMVAKSLYKTGGAWHAQRNSKEVRRGHSDSIVNTCCQPLVCQPVVLRPFDTDGCRQVMQKKIAAKLAAEKKR